MNLDNYFSQFENRSALCGNGDNTSNSACKNTGGITVLSQTTNTVPLNAPHDVVRSLNDNGFKCSSPDAALQASHFPTNAAGENLFPMIQSALIDITNVASQAPSTISPPLSNHNNEGGSSRCAKMSRTERESSPTSLNILKFARPLSLNAVPMRAVRATAPYPDEEDELDLLLGKEKAQEVKQIDALMCTQVASPVGQKSVFPNDSYPEDSFLSARSFGSLLGGPCPNSILKEYTKYFERQFMYELQANRNLFDSFRPFLKDKVLHRIGSDSGLHPFFSSAPTLSAATTVALPGYALRDYQLAGVQFLLNNFHRGMSCILSDDMGLGKTAQIASFLHVLKTLHHIDGPHLIVTPLSTLTSWTRELARWASGLKLVKYHGERRARNQARSSHHARHAVVVTTPAILTQDRSFFRKRTWVTIIVDEAHVLKGRDTQITATARKLTACFRIAVTGTPVHNNVREVWSLMSFLYPLLMVGHDCSVTCSDSDDAQAAENGARLLGHIMLRRTKASLELGIPPRVDEPVTMLEPSFIQAQVLARLTARVLKDDESARRLQVHLSHHRAVCNHPMALRLLANERRGCNTAEGVEGLLQSVGIPMSEAVLVQSSAKMVYLDGLLKQLNADRHRCIIFSNFTSTLDLLEGFCRLRGYSYERLDGSCNRVERELSMLRYNAPSSSCFVFLATTTAGGVGVTLTGADTVILFDAHFNPQLDRQAADRAHRIGQTRVVHVYRLCLKNTIEEHIRGIADRKASLGDYIVDGARRNSDVDAPNLSAEDIRKMLRNLDSEQREKYESAAVMPSTAVSTDDDLKIVEDLVHIETDGLQRCEWPEKPTKRTLAVFGLTTITTHSCFVCGGIMHPFEPLYHCGVCPKAYHAECIGMKKRKLCDTASRQWSCPRHACSACGKAQATDGALFMCISCPQSFCFDCLDPRYLAIDESGSQLLHIKRMYSGMKDEGMATRRSCYYISCLHCCGVETSSSSSSFDDEGGEELASDDTESIADK